MYQRILVPIDGSETARCGLQEAIRLAKAGGGQLCLFHVIDDLSFALAMDAYAGQQGDWLNTMREAGARLLDEAKGTAAAAGVKAEGVLYERVSTRLADAVAAEAAKWKADLIVLGTHGRRGVGRLLLGSGAESVLRSAPIPVLVVRAKATDAQPAEEAAEAPRVHVSLVTGALKIE
ncbi:MAG: universal stress protein [Proteobacteria bacterium]|nr:universal stress protein [Pseudomonadota bacterium]